MGELGWARKWKTGTLLNPKYQASPASAREKTISNLPKQLAGVACGFGIVAVIVMLAAHEHTRQRAALEQ